MSTATWRIDWQNPRIHTGDRWKTWLACDEHVEYLRGFLEARSFPVRVAPFVADDDGCRDGRPSRERVVVPQVAAMGRATSRS